MARVLIVDDEESLRALYQSELTEEGHDVLVASNGKEAMALLQEEALDAVIMDIHMPEMDGIEALGKVVARHKGIPIIINSAYPRYQEDFRAWAAEAYVVKSSDLTDLKQALREVLTRASAKR